MSEKALMKAVSELAHTNTKLMVMIQQLHERICNLYSLRYDLVARDMMNSPLFTKPKDNGCGQPTDIDSAAADIARILEQRGAAEELGREADQQTISL